MTMSFAPFSRPTMPDRREPRVGVVILTPDLLRFTERIPFSETRGYVKNVRPVSLYRALYRPRLCDVLDVGFGPARGCLL